MFTSCDNSGFHITFENGWTVSVQWSPGNYCEHHWANIDGKQHEVALWKSADAEIAAWDKDNDWYDFGDDTVKGYLKADEVLEFMNKIANLKEKEPELVKDMSEIRKELADSLDD